MITFSPHPTRSHHYNNTTEPATLNTSSPDTNTIMIQSLPLLFLLHGTFVYGTSLHSSSAGGSDPAKPAFCCGAFYQGLDLICHDCVNHGFCCATGSCNIFCCNCDGHCRTGACSVSSLPENEDGLGSTFEGPNVNGKVTLNADGSISLGQFLTWVFENGDPTALDNTARVLAWIDHYNLYDANNDGLVSADEIQAPPADQSGHHEL
ncbi:hypothetical protein F4678DRAFT_443954 [Xylaria arbuscula]|nr:hypothetical protein F4678DRAFT_443954 [Xylaria arbuscula]